MTRTLLKTRYGKTIFIIFYFHDFFQNIRYRKVVFSLILFLGLFSCEYGEMNLNADSEILAIGEKYGISLKISQSVDLENSIQFNDINSLEKFIQGVSENRGSFSSDQILIDSNPKARGGASTCLSGSRKKDSYFNISNSYIECKFRF